MPRRGPRSPYLGPFGPEPEADRLRSPLPRLAWRYRSELAPLTLALALLAAGVVLHAWWPGWWQVVAAVGVAAGLVVGDLGHRLGLDRPIERGYASAVTATAGLWLAAATRLGPLRRPCCWSCSPACSWVGCRGGPTGAAAPRFAWSRR
jgi:hypothetical protein